jgi:hypothetical protein
MEPLFWGEDRMRHNTNGSSDANHQRNTTMPNDLQIATYNFIRSEITRLRGPQSDVQISLDEVTPLEDDGDRATFRVKGARVFIENSGVVVARYSMQSLWPFGPPC